MFIAFEGIDGCGKRTQLLKVLDWLDSQNKKVVSSSEPNDKTSPLGKKIKEMLRGETCCPPKDPLEFQRLYVQDRAQDITCFIKPALQAGSIYLIERFALSTIAYGMVSFPMDRLIRLHEEIIGQNMLWPDLNIIIDIPAEEAIRRITRRNGGSENENEFFEKQSFLDKVRQNYLKIVESSYFKQSAVLIDGTGTTDEIFQRIKRVIPIL